MRCASLQTAIRKFTINTQIRKFLQNSAQLCLKTVQKVCFLKMIFLFCTNLNYIIICIGGHCYCIKLPNKLYRSHRYHYRGIKNMYWLHRFCYWGIKKSTSYFLPWVTVINTVAPCFLTLAVQISFVTINSYYKKIRKMKVWWHHDATLFVYFWNFTVNKLYSFNHPLPFAEVPLHFLIAGQLSG